MSLANSLDHGREDHRDRDVGHEQPASSSTVGATSMKCVGACRSSPLAAIPRGQWAMKGDEIPPS